ncbi:MAG TPA: hypothetical protein VKX17_22640 [Planctomycetota bacterium]|nr:hypothetical protein [Planctomycetota bacterium]
MDALIKVYLKDGREQWVLIHIEVQSQPDPQFGERMYIYNYRGFDLFMQRVASFAILGDDDQNWRPQSFESGIWGCRARLDFPIIKLLDFRADAETLLKHENPFATFVLAHLKTLETRHNPVDRLAWKTALIKNLYRYGSNRTEVEELIRFIDWLMILPDNLQDKCVSEIEKWEEPKAMSYVTSFERHGMKIGRREGIKQGRERGRREGIQTGTRKSILVLLEERFGKVPVPIISVVNSIDNSDKLTELLRVAARIGSLKEFPVK